MRRSGDATADGTAVGRLEDNLPELITAFWLTEQTGELTLQKGLPIAEKKR